MIKIKKAKEPAYLSSPAVEVSKVNLRNQVAAKSPKLDIPNHWGDVNADNTIKDDLFKIHSEKCCYCERKRTRKREMDVEHYRPKAEITGIRDPRGYWWLSYTWSNYLWSCKSCNQGYKKNQFPLLPGGKRATTEDGDLKLELPILINPRFDEPTRFLAYYKKKLGGKLLVRIIPLPDLTGDEKSRAFGSIRILGLNRTDKGDDLISDRGDSLSPDFEHIAYNLKAAISAAEKTVDPKVAQYYENKILDFRAQLKTYVRAGREFSGFLRYFLSDLDIDYSDLI